MEKDYRELYDMNPMAFLMCWLCPFMTLNRDGLWTHLTKDMLKQGLYRPGMSRCERALKANSLKKK